MEGFGDDDAPFEGFGDDAPFEGFGEDAASSQEAVVAESQDQEESPREVADEPEELPSGGLVESEFTESVPEPLPVSKEPDEKIEKRGRKRGRRDPSMEGPTYEEGLFAPPSEPRRRKGSNMQFLLALQKGSSKKPTYSKVDESEGSESERRDTPKRGDPDEPLAKKKRGRPSKNTVRFEDSEAEIEPENLPEKPERESEIRESLAKNMDSESENGGGLVIDEKSKESRKSKKHKKDKQRRSGQQRSEEYYSGETSKSRETSEKKMRSERSDSEEVPVKNQAIPGQQDSIAMAMDMLGSDDELPAPTSNGNPQDDQGELEDVVPPRDISQNENFIPDRTQVEEGEDDRQFAAGMEETPEGIPRPATASGDEGKSTHQQGRTQESSPTREGAQIETERCERAVEEAVDTPSKRTRAKARKSFTLDSKDMTPAVLEIKPEPVENTTPIPRNETPSGLLPQKALSPSVASSVGLPAGAVSARKRGRGKGPEKPQALTLSASPRISTPRGIKVDLANPALQVPFSLGFKRELVHRATGGGADVYYFPPVGKKLRSMNEISDYINQNGMGLSVSNFTFQKTLISGDPQYETARGASSCPGKQPSAVSFSTPPPARESPKPPKSGGLKIRLSVKKRSQETPLQSEEPSSEGVTPRRRRVVPALKTGSSQEDTPRVPPITLSVKPLASPVTPIAQASWADLLGEEVQPTLKTPIIDTTVETTPAEPEKKEDRPAVPEAISEETPPARKTISVRKASDLFPSARVKRPVKMPTRFVEEMKVGSPALAIQIFKRSQDPALLTPEVSPLKGPKAVAPCTVLCSKARGQFPSLSCQRCLCLFHATCLGYPASHTSGSDFVCPGCKSDEVQKNPQQIEQNVSPLRVTPQNRSSIMKLKFDGSKFAVTKQAMFLPPTAAVGLKPTVRYIQPKVASVPTPATPNTVSLSPLASPRAEPEPTAPAVTKAISPPMVSSAPVLVPAPTAVAPALLRQVSSSIATQTNPEDLVPPKPPTPPPPPPRPVVGCQSIEHIRDKQNRLRRFIVISNTPVTEERPCPFAPLPELPATIPETAREPDESQRPTRPAESISAKDPAPKPIQSSPWSTDFMNTLSYAYKGILHAFKYLPPVERSRAALTCKLWYKIVNEPEIWGSVDTRKLKIRSLRTFFARARKLEIASLDLRGIEGKQRESMVKYLNVPDAKRVLLCPCPAEAVEVVLRTCTDLNLLEAEQITTRPLNLQDIKYHYRMEKLVLDSSESVDVLNLSDLSKLHKMKHLSILCAQTVSDVKFLELMPSLETLRLGSLSHLDEEKSRNLNFKNVKNLVSLRLEHGPEWDTDMTLLKSFGSLKELKHLELFNFKAETGLAETLRGMPKLENFLFMPSVSIDTSEATFGDLLDHLPELSNLKSFCLLIHEDCFLFDGTIVIRHDTIKKLDSLKEIPRNEEKPMEIDIAENHRATSKQGDQPMEELGEPEAVVNDVINDPRIWAALENAQLVRPEEEHPILRLNGGVGGSSDEENIEAPDSNKRPALSVGSPLQRILADTIGDDGATSRSIFDLEETADLGEAEASGSPLQRVLEGGATTQTVETPEKSGSSSLERILADTVYCENRDAPVQASSIFDLEYEIPVEPLPQGDTPNQAGLETEGQGSGASDLNDTFEEGKTDSELDFGDVITTADESEASRQDMIGTRGPAENAGLPSLEESMDPDSQQPLESNYSLSESSRDISPVKAVPHEKVVFKLGGSENSSVFDESSKSDSVKAAVGNVVSSLFDIESVDELPRADDSNGQRSQYSVEQSENAQPAILSSFREPQDENAHMGPPTPLVTEALDQSLLEQQEESQSEEEVTEALDQSVVEESQSEEEVTEALDQSAVDEQEDSQSEEEVTEALYQSVVEEQEDSQSEKEVTEALDQSEEEATEALDQSLVEEQDSSLSEEEEGLDQSGEKTVGNDMFDVTKAEHSQPGVAEQQERVSDWQNLSESEDAAILDHSGEKNIEGQNVAGLESTAEFQTLSEKQGLGYENGDVTGKKCDYPEITGENGDACEAESPACGHAEQPSPLPPKVHEVPSFRADDPCTVTPEALYEYFKLALPSVKVAVIKVNEENVKRIRLSHVDYENNLLNID